MYFYLTSFYSSPVFYYTDSSVVYVNSSSIVSSAFLYDSPSPTPRTAARHNSSILFTNPTVQNTTTASPFPTEVAEQEEDVPTTILKVQYAGNSLDMLNRLQRSTVVTTPLPTDVIPTTVPPITFSPSSLSRSQVSSSGASVTPKLGRERRHRRAAHRRNSRNSLQTNLYSYYHYDYPPDHVGDGIAKTVINRIVDMQSSLMMSLQHTIANQTRQYLDVYNSIVNDRLDFDAMATHVRRKEEAFTNMSCIICPATTPFSVQSILHPRGSVIRKFVGNREVFNINTKENLWFPKRNTTYSVTLVSVATSSRLFMVSHLLSRWPGPLVVTFFSSFREQSVLLDFVRNNVLPERLTLLFYFVKSSDNQFPINYLRTLGIYNIRSTHFIVLDIDLSITSNLYSETKRIPSSVMRDRKAAVILPVFFYHRKEIIKRCSTYHDCFTLGLAIQPENKRDLAGCLKSRVCLWRKTWYRTHAYTLPEWFTLSDDPVSKIVCMTMDFQEPYMILPYYRGSIMFDDRFSNYGYNKVQLFEHVRAAGYKFYILNNAFAMDLPHRDSVLRQRYITDSRPKVRTTYRIFQKELILQYGLNRNYHWCSLSQKKYYSKVCVCFLQTIWHFN